MRAEWRKAPDFAEIAEALDVRTDQVVAASPQRGGASWVAMFTREEGEADVFAAALTRDRDGILRVKGEQLVPGFWATLRHNLDRELGEPDAD